MLARRAIPIALVAVALTTFVVTVASYIDAPLRFDEAEWPIYVAGLLRHGVPIVDAAETKIRWPAVVPFQETQYGLWHPPLYHYSMAAIARVGGFSNWVLRAHNLIWFAGILALCWRILGIIMPPDSSRLSRTAPIALILLSPFLSEGSLLLDIDNTVLAFFLLLFLQVVLTRSDARPLSSDTLLSGIAFGATLLTKLTSSILVVPVVGLYLWTHHGFRKALGTVIVITSVGVGGFAALYALYCWAFDYPWRFMFDVSYMAGKTGPAPHIWTIAQSVRWHLLWISPGVVFLLVVATLTRARAAVAARALRPADLLSLCGIAILTPYIAWVGFFGKYTVPGVILLILGLAPTLDEALREALSDQRAGSRLLWISLPVLALQAAFLPSLQVRPASAGGVVFGWYESVMDRRNLVLLLALVSLALVVAAAWRMHRAVRVSSRLMIAGVLYTLLANPANIIKTVVSDYDRGPYRPFVDTGFAATVSYLNSTYPNGAVIAPKDIGYYYEGLNFPIESIDVLYGIDALLEPLLTGRAAAFVDSVKYPASPRAKGALPAGLRVVYCGDFAIYSFPNEHQRSTAQGPLSCPESKEGARRADPLRAAVQGGA